MSSCNAQCRLWYWRAALIAAAVAAAAQGETDGSLIADPDTGLELETGGTQRERPLVGINYFAGWWTGAGNKWRQPWNASVDWRGLYPERVPLLGAYNSQKTMDAEITAAADAGVDFFQILWYDDHPERAPNARLLNRGVSEFMASPNSSRMRFFIEWCNSAPLFNVSSDQDWATMVYEDWLPAFKHPSYLRVGGALVFKVISAGGFLKNGCGMNHTLAEARWQMLRDVVRLEGLGEMIIGAGQAAPDKDEVGWWAKGQYNWTGLYCAVDHDDPAYTGHVLPWQNESEFVNTNRQQHAQTSAAAGVPFLPMVVSGWDPRPWREKRASFAFPTDAEWEAELETVKEQLALGGTSNLGLPLPNGEVQPAFNIYAWNEFGEGGMMAPTRGWKYKRLEAIARVFGKPKATSTHDI